MNKKRDARVSYLDGAITALQDHMKATEEGLLKLPGIEHDEAEKLIASVRKRHKKLVHKIEREMASEGA